MINMINKFKARIESLIRKARVRRCRVPFVVLFRERSGSSHLCSILSNHKEIVCRQEDFSEIRAEQVRVKPDGEAFEFGNREFYRYLQSFDNRRIVEPTDRQVITHLQNVFSFPATASGFKFKFPLQPLMYPTVLKELKAIGPDLRIIMLTRTNAIKQAVSKQNMLHFQQSLKCNSTANLWKSKVSSDARNLNTRPAFHLDVEEAISYARNLVHTEVEFQAMADPFRAEHPVLDVVYEKLLSEQAETVKAIFEFLSVAPDAAIFSGTNKATSDRLEDAISNFSELHDAIAGTNLEHFLK